MIAKLLSGRRWRKWWHARRDDVRQLGAGNAIKLAMAQGLTILMKDARLLRGNDDVWALRTRSLMHPLYFRPLGSDLYVIRQILVEEEHAVLRDLEGVRVVMDCGANIGCAAAYFLSRFPAASLVAVEPEPSNVALLRRNLAPYGPRATVLHAAVWSSNRSVLRCARGSYRDGLAWATRVECVSEGEGDIRSITMSDLLAMSPTGEIDLLKVDVEGSEATIFSSPCDDWLSHTRNVCIELHGPECEAAFESALASYEYVRQLAGELVIARGLHSRGHANSQCSEAPAHVRHAVESRPA